MKELIVAFFIILTGDLFGQNDSWKYLNQAPPGRKAELFAPAVINHIAHSSPSFTPDGKEIYWSTVGENNKTRKIYFVKYGNNKWSEPAIVSFSGDYHDDQPFVSYNGQKLYFASKRPKKDGNTDNDIWISDKTESGWGEPKTIDNLIGFWTPAVTHTGTIYFIELIEQMPVICKAEFNGGKYQDAEILNENINQKGARNWCPFIAPDESYLIFTSDREGGYGSGDLYISFKNDKGQWQKAINLGSSVNTDKQERFPGVSPDGKYLFFTRWLSQPYYHDLYWIDAGIINELKNIVTK